MMSKILIMALILSSVAIAQDGSEEAIILNQELKYLEDSAKTVSLANESKEVEEILNEPDLVEMDGLEGQYFASEEDEVTTKTASPKRKRSY